MKKNYNTFKKTFFRDSYVSDDTFQKLIEGSENEEVNNIARILQDKNNKLIFDVGEKYSLINILIDKINNEIKDKESEVESINIEEIKKMIPNFSFESTSVEEIALKKEELLRKIKNHEEVIKELEENQIPSKVASIEKNEQTLKNYLSERKVIMDQVSEDKMRSITGCKRFRHSYQVRTLKFIFDNILNLKCEIRIKEELAKNNLEKSDGNFDREWNEKDDDSSSKVYREAMNDIVMHEYNLNCYNAWKFKNILVNLEELNINLENSKEYENTITHLRKLIQLGASQINLENPSSKDESQYYDIFKPFLNLLEILAFITLGTKKVNKTREQLEELKGKRNHSENYKNECKGKIELLDELIKRMGGSSSSSIEKKTNTQIQLTSNDSDKLSFDTLIQMVNQLQSHYKELIKTIGKGLVSVKEIV